MKNIVMYICNNCSFCHKARQFFMENNIDYTEYNISQDIEAKKELIKKGYCSVPIIKIGDMSVVGFDEDKIKSLLQL
jgi:glutaredoxin 3